MSTKELIKNLRLLSYSTGTGNLLTELEAEIAKYKNDSALLDWIDENKPQIDTYWVTEDGEVVVDHFVAHNLEGDEIVALNIRDLIKQVIISEKEIK